MTSSQKPVEPGSEESPVLLRLRAIACEVLARPTYLYAALSPNVVDVTLLRRRLHDTPQVLRERLQAEIDTASAADPPYDAIVLAYGLCGGATAGIAAGSVPLVVPRAHDCVTLLLGSRERYEHEFAAHPGTYWFAPDYLERDQAASEEGGVLGLGAATKEAQESLYADFVARFGEDNAAYLMEALGGWSSHYDRAAYVDTGRADRSGMEARARDEAKRRGWLYERLPGELGLVRRLLDGEWADDFLILSPGQRLAMSYDAAIVHAEPTSG